MYSTFDKIDFFVFEKIIHRVKCKFLDKTMPFITHLGDLGLVWIVVILLLLINRETRQKGVFCAITLFLATISCNLVFKSIFKRVRPFEREDNIKLLITPPTTSSFPSGHTTSSFAVASAIFAFDKKFGALALFGAILIGFSRMYLYVHYPSDIIGGVFLGLICTLLTYIVF